MNAARPQPATIIAANPASAVRRDTPPGSSASIGNASLQIEEPMANQPSTRILGVLRKPSRGAAQPEAVTPVIHIAAYALSADIRQGLRQDHLQVAHRAFFRIVAARIRI